MPDEQKCPACKTPVALSAMGEIEVHHVWSRRGPYLVLCPASGRTPLEIAELLGLLDD